MAIVALALAVACARGAAFHAAPAVLEGNVMVHAYRISAEGEGLAVMTTIRNDSGAPITIDHDEWALRLPSGELIRRASGAAMKVPRYALAPGETRRVRVDFHRPGWRMSTLVDGAVLVVGGTTFAADPTPRAIGEIPISADPVPSEPGQPASIATPPPVAAAPVPSALAAEPAPNAPGAPPAAAGTDCAKELGAHERLKCAALKLEPGMNKEAVQALLGVPSTTEYGTGESDGQALKWRYDTGAGQPLRLVFKKGDEWRLSAWSWEERK